MWRVPYAVVVVLLPPRLRSAVPSLRAHEKRTFPSDRTRGHDASSVPRIPLPKIPRRHGQTIYKPELPTAADPDGEHERTHTNARPRINSRRSIDAWREWGKRAPRAASEQNVKEETARKFAGIVRFVVRDVPGTRRYRVQSVSSPLS